jgi:hypothetical protein
MRIAELTVNKNLNPWQENCNIRFNYLIYLLYLCIIHPNINHLGGEVT